MRQLSVDFFTSLDGFAADAAGTQHWIHGLVGPDTGAYIQRVLAEPQILLLGRKTYEVLSGYWPEAREPQAGPMNAHPKLVFSTTLQPPLAWANSRLAQLPLVEQVAALKRESGPRLRTIGSLGLVRSLLEAGLVDRIHLLVFPITLGAAGREPIFAGHGTRRFDQVSTNVFDGNILALDYRVAASS